MDIRNGIGPVCVALVLGLVTGLGSTHQAQGADDAGRKRAKLVIDSGVLVGKIRKPQVQFLISREKGVNQEAIELKESFVPKVIEAVQETPF